MPPLSDAADSQNVFGDALAAAAARSDIESTNADLHRCISEMILNSHIGSVIVIVINYESNKASEHF